MCVCSVFQSCVTLCNPMDCSLPGPSVNAILQAEILPFPTSWRSSRPRDRTHISYISCIGKSILYCCTTWEVLRQDEWGLKTCLYLQYCTVHVNVCEGDWSHVQGSHHNNLGASLVAQLGKNLPAMRKTWVRSLGRENPLENGMATHSSILVWRIPWTEEPGGLQSMGLQRVRQDWVNMHST